MARKREEIKHTFQPLFDENGELIASDWSSDEGQDDEVLEEEVESNE